MRLSGSSPYILRCSWGVGLFIYQSLDAIDGKQARRTGASSPLGEVFDHGKQTYLFYDHESFL